MRSAAFFYWLSYVPAKVIFGVTLSLVLFFANAQVSYACPWVCVRNGDGGENCGCEGNWHLYVDPIISGTTITGVTGNSDWIPQEYYSPPEPAPVYEPPPVYYPPAPAAPAQPTFTNKAVNNNVYVAGMGWLTPDRAKELSDQRVSAGLAPLVVNEQGHAVAESYAASSTTGSIPTTSLDNFVASTPTGSGPVSNCYDWDIGCVINTLQLEARQADREVRSDSAVSVTITTTEKKDGVTIANGVERIKLDDFEFINSLNSGIVGLGDNASYNNLSAALTNPGAAGEGQATVENIIARDTKTGQWILASGNDNVTDYRLIRGGPVTIADETNGIADTMSAVRDTAPNQVIPTCLADNFPAGCVGSRFAGGCRWILTCNCGGGSGSDSFACTNSTTGSQAAARCEQSVCSEIGSMVTLADGTQKPKSCQPGSITSCDYNTGQGSACNDTGTGTVEGINAHACGYVGVRIDQEEITLLETEAGKPGSTIRITDLLNGIGVKTFEELRAGGENGGFYLSGSQLQPVKGQNGGSSVFVGCGNLFGASGSYNCYSVVNAAGESSITCANEPNLSCGARPPDSPPPAPTQQLVTATSVAPPPSNNPPPVPPGTPSAVCGYPCGANAGGATCSGSNMACVEGICRSTLCAPAEQNNQCVCAPQPFAPICVDIYASTANPKLGDQVTFTCAEVTNAVRYEFRYAYLKDRDGDIGASVASLATKSETSRESVPLSIDKIGRYVVQCRPCAQNDLCSAWEPLTGQIGGPELPPVPTPSPTPVASVSAQLTESSTSTESGQQSTPTPTPTPSPTPMVDGSTATESAMTP